MDVNQYGCHICFWDILPSLNNALHLIPLGQNIAYLQIVKATREGVRCAETMPTLYGTRTFGIRAAPGISQAVEGTLGTAKEVHAS